LFWPSKRGTEVNSDNQQFTVPFEPLSSAREFCTAVNFPQRHHSFHRRVRLQLDLKPGLAEERTVSFIKREAACLQ